jgi:hypothetical protein
MLNLVFFTRVPSEKLYHLRYFLIMVSLEGPEKGDRKREWIEINRPGLAKEQSIEEKTTQQ